MYGNEQYIVHLNNVGPKQTTNNPFSFLGYPRRVNIPKEQSESYIEEEQTTQWLLEKVQKDKNDLQNIHIKLKIE